MRNKSLYSNESYGPEQMGYDSVSPNQSITATNSVSSNLSVGAINPHASSIDAISVWRFMSEKYKTQRLERETQAEKEDSSPKQNKAQSIFQKNYEKDYVDLESLNLISTWRENLLKKTGKIELPIDEASIIYANKPKASDHTIEEKLLHNDIITVADVMSRHIISVLDSTKIEAVINIFNKHKIHSAPVIDYVSNCLCGIITSTDIFKHINDNKTTSTVNNYGSFFTEDNSNILEQPVKNFMNTNVVTVLDDCDISKACKIMKEHSIHRVIVVNNDYHVKGVFSSLDAVGILACLTH